VAFDLFRSLPKDSINSWPDLETRFLSQFYENDTELTVDIILSIVQKGGEFKKDFIGRFTTSLFVPRRYAFNHIASDI